ncbi:MAG TPA: M50 family metallopeptidase [Sulfuricaulis sp.]|nr:M50 family metallopeptidase [Sulfuricaulis sp.]
MFGIKPWRLGRLLGFPIDLNPSFLLLLGLVLVMFGGIGGVIAVLVLFASVLVHELGHAVVGRRLGVDTDSIELGFLGGAARMVDMPMNARAEILIAAAGPAVSLAIGFFALAIGHGATVPFIAMIGWINLVLAGFNLIPALPMDGGRILRAALSTRFRYVRATEIAVKVSRVAAGAFLVLGIVTLNWSLLILAPFLWIQGARELMIARYRAQDMGEVTVLPRNAWDNRDRAPQATGLRGFRMVMRNGRMVIELD